MTLTRWGRTSTLVHQADMYCPGCGQAQVYAEPGDAGDYYVGPTFYCVACHGDFTFQGVNKSTDWSVI